MALIDAFNDVPSVPLKTPQASEDSNSFGQFGALQVGGLGTKAFRTDDQGIWLGAIKFADAPFSVSMEGAITGTSGTIAGWTIGDTTIYKNNATLDSAGQITLGTADDIAIMSSVNATYRLWIGDATAGDAAFSVTKGGVLYATGANISGAITATSGTIGGFTIGATYLYAGATTNTVGLSPGDYPFWAGDTYANRATAPFRVTPAGAATCSNLTVTGGSITIGTANNVCKIDSTGNMWSGNATQGSAPFQVSYAGAIIVTDILCNVTSETGGGTGADFKYGGASRVLINGSGVLLRNTRGLFFEGTTGGQYWDFQVNGSNQAVTSLPSSNQFFMKNYAGDVNLFTVSATTTFSEHYFSSTDNYIKLNGNNLTLNNGGCTISNDTLDLPNSKQLWIGAGDNFSINGNSKNAIVPTSEGYKALYCAEAPEVWFFDFCKSKDTVDPMFLQVTEGEIEWIKTEDGWQVWRRRKGHANKRFEQKTALQFYKNEMFLGMAH